ncbi:MAG: hypothetical protein IT320_10565 [Anaerolineae bacterium]|nr:hypothetical protein [Anaerolineae bacterium]
MKSGDKARALIAMWIVTAIVAGATLNGLNVSSGSAWVLAVLGLAFAGMAVGGTYIVAIMTKTMPDGEEMMRDTRTYERGKAKTSDMALVDRMVDNLNDEELAALRRRLLAGGDDGEVLSLEEALHRRRGE